MPRCPSGRYLRGFLVGLSAGFFFLYLSPYGSTLYAIPARGIYVDWCQNDSIWADLSHDISGLSASARRADVLILGSSKPLFGISARIIAERFDKHGLRIFNLGIGGGEGIRGAAQIINRLDLRRKTLLVNLDDNMISDFVSDASRAALRMDRFQAATRVASVRLKAIGDAFLDQTGLPQLRYAHGRYVLAPRSTPRSYRDVATGDIVSATRIDTRPPGTQLLPAAQPGSMLRPDTLDSPHFKSILRDWQARGMQLVFFTIPYGTGVPGRNNYNPTLAHEAAVRFGGEHVDLDWRIVRSADGIHVDKDSRARLSESLAEQLADPSRVFAARVLSMRGLLASTD